MSENFTELPIATKEECEKRREFLIKHGIIKPATNDKKTKRDELIEKGIIIPRGENG